MSHGVLNSWRHTSFGKLSRKAGSSLLPITDLVAPVSTIPVVPCVAKSTGSGSRRLLSVDGSVVSCLETSFLGSRLFRLLSPMLFPLSRRRSLSLDGMDVRKLIKCKLDSSSVDSWTMGNLMNSNGKASGSPEGLTASAVIVAAVDDDVLAVALRRSGHSAFQWPRFPHSLQVLSMILC